MGTTGGDGCTGGGSVGCVPDGAGGLMTAAAFGRGRTGRCAGGAGGVALEAWGGVTGADVAGAEGVCNWSSARESTVTWAIAGQQAKLSSRPTSKDVEFRMPSITLTQ